MNIRPATIIELSVLCQLDTFAAEDSGRREAIHSWIDQGICHLAEVDGEPAGYGVLAYHFFGSAFIEMLMVDVRFRGRGVGFALVEHFKRTCLGPKLFSSTNLSNHAMQSLLLKARFRPSGFIDNLDENDPELVFFYPVS